MELKKFEDILNEEGYQDATVSGVHNVQTGSKTVGERWEFYMDEKSRLMVNIDGKHVSFMKWYKSQSEQVIQSVVDKISAKASKSFTGSIDDPGKVGVFIAKSLRRNVEPWDFKKQKDGTVVLNALNEI